MIGGRIINKARFADDTVIVAKTQEELQDMKTLVDTGRKYGMKINIDKSQVMIKSRRNESLWVKVGNREHKKLVILNNL